MSIVDAAYPHEVVPLCPLVEAGNSRVDPEAPNLREYSSVRLPSLLTSTYEWDIQ